jgi:putative heme-binding domain-containing protein
LSRADAAGLVAALESPSGVVRDLAQQQLAWRPETAVAAAPRLAKLAATGERAEARAQALWSLHTIGALKADVVRRALDDPHPGVRRQAVRLSEDFVATEPALLAAVAAKVDDTDDAVRLQTGYTLGAWQAPAAGEALARLLQREGDRFVKAAALSSALPHAETLLMEFQRQGREGEALLLEVATVTENMRALAGLLATVAGPRVTADWPAAFGALAQLLDWLQRNNRTLAQLQRTADEPMRRALDATDAIFAASRRVAADDRANAAARVAALRIVGRGRSRQDEDFELIAGLLNPRIPVEVQVAAVAALGRMNRPTVPERVLAGWSGHGPTVRSAVVELLTSRIAWSQTLLDYVEKNPAMLGQIDPAQKQRMTHHIDAKLADRATRVFQAGTDPNRQAAIDRMLTALADRRGDPAKGAVVFARNCQACHAFGAAGGGAIGPDLATVRDRSAPYLVTHILDPNRAVEDRYMMYAATLLDGRSLAGMLIAEAGNSIMLRGLDGTEHVILRNELRLFVSSGRSLMPEGLEAVITPPAMADLVAYLAAASR